jgi:hypothetical protein
VRSESSEREVDLTLPALEDDQDEVVVTLRVVRLNGPDGVPMILLTSLGQAEASLAELQQIYKLRSELETFFALAKSDYLDQGQFHARSAVGVEQEIYTLFLFISLSRFLMAQAAEAHDVPALELSTKAGVLGVAENLVPLLLSTDPEQIGELLRKLFARMARRRYKRRLGRSFLRRSFRPVRKWGADGRRGDG